MRKLFFPTNSRLYNASVAFSLIGVTLTLVSFFVPRPYISFFGWLFIYMPFLWALWLCCVFFARLETKSRKILYLWLLIDFTVLFLFLSFSIAVDNWAHSSGIELVYVLVNFPVAMPLLWILGWFPRAVRSEFLNFFDVLAGLFGSGPSGAIAIWLTISAVSIIQSTAVIVIVRFLQPRAAKVGLQ
ncbi:MAG: hypothetical protein ABIT83_06180 [Massilia sp.]